MALTQPQRIQISGELLDLPLKVAAANATSDQLDDVKADLAAQDQSLKIFFDKYNGIANAYQTERRWVDGTTYTVVLEADLDLAARRQPGNNYFPTDASWTKFQPRKHATNEGTPTTSSPNYELEVFTKPIETEGLTALLNYLLNGQSSGVADTTLSADYIPGSGTMMVTAGGQTVGKLIIVSGGGFSGLFKVDVSAGTTLTVTEVIPPNGTLPLTVSTVKENIIAFTNSERNTLTSAAYQNVITVLATKIKSAVNLWEAAVDAQLVQLNANVDSRSPQATQITTAIADAQSAKTTITTWEAFPDTGTILTDSKFVNVNITPLQTKVTSRTSFAGTRNTQITTALGSITQAPAGTYTGVGIYYLRFQQIDSRINLAGGPLTEFYEKDISIDALAQIVTNANDRQTTFGGELKVAKITPNPTGTTLIKVEDATGFSNGNTVFVVADSLSELTGTIVSINGLDITLSFTVPATYTVDARARLYKQL